MPVTVQKNASGHYQRFRRASICFDGAINNKPKRNRGLLPGFVLFITSLVSFFCQNRQTRTKNRQNPLKKRQRALKNRQTHAKNRPTHAKNRQTGLKNRQILHKGKSL
ncbi:hypothetical protein [Neobacillus bataviensis]|uniref:hypothetical protein n=1 Tax=Neobacillus bataviensis TaxID=220685 RepID=UPI001CC11929|nr:hypothetical protein [Neobacillus bataviensis]